MATEYISPENKDYEVKPSDDYGKTSLQFTLAYTEVIFCPTGKPLNVKVNQPICI